MNQSSTMGPAGKLEVFLNNFSDDVLIEEAECFMSGRQRLTSSQMHGLINIAGSVASLGEILRFCRHQKEKARNEEEKTLWNELEEKLQRLATTGIEAMKEFVADGKIKRELELAVVRNFLRHLGAENAYQGKKNKGA